MSRATTLQTREEQSRLTPVDRTAEEVAAVARELRAWVIATPISALTPHAWWMRMRDLNRALTEYVEGVDVAQAGRAASIQHLYDFGRKERNHGARVSRTDMRIYHALDALWPGNGLVKATPEIVSAIRAQLDRLSDPTNVAADYARRYAAPDPVAAELNTVDHAAVLRGLHRQMGALIEAFGRGEAVDPRAVEDLGIQIGRYVGTAQAIRDAERATEPVAA